MYNYHKTHHKSSYIWECENRSLLRKGSPEGQKSVLTELDWASPRQSSETAGEQVSRQITPSQQKSRPLRNIRTGREKKRSTRAYGFGGAVVEAGFGVVEAAGRLAAGLGAAADALAG